MLNALLCTFIIALLTAGSYYASYQWVNLRHNRDIVADELKRAMGHIEDLEARIAMMEADKSLNEFKARPKEENSGWDTFSARG